VSETAFLGLGSNLGDRLDTLGRAVSLLGEAHGVVPTACSRVWETAPVGGPPQPDFLNLVLRVEAERTPRELLTLCHEVEAALGRVRDVRWGPRTIDVDLLLFGDRTVDEPDLIVPHPRLHERAFVVLPLLDVASDPRLPDGRRILDLPVASDAVRPVAAPFPLG
jgi:2-amino-4-hydroxy-6-hydroxymethyldihydropteridine diphosphokinase